MSKKTRRIAVESLALLTLFQQSAYAGTGTITVKDAGSVTRTFDVVTDGSGNFGAMGAICDGAALASCATVGTYGTAPGAVAALNVNASVTNANANGQATMANSSPVALASNQSVGDPCAFQAKTFTAVSSSLGSAILVTGLSGKKVYGCSFVGIAGSATVFNLIEGTGTTCLGGTVAAILGATASASGLSFAANGGMTLGGGDGTVLATANATNGICMFQSTTSLFAGILGYVQQ